MNTTFKLLLLSITMSLLACSSATQMLPDPIDKQNLLIGRLILNVDGYEGNFLTMRENIEVAIIGRIIEAGQIKTISRWTLTDEDGYFYLANVPDGEYALKGFRFSLIGTGDFIIANDLTDPQRNYYELKTRDVMSLTGNLFDTKSHQRIVNFKHNIFTLYPDGLVRFQRLDRLRDVKLATGEIVSSPPVPYYFFEKFEESSWAPFLEMQIK